MNASEVLSLILIAVVVVDIIAMRVENRKLRDYKRTTSPNELKVEMTCDNSDFLAKMAEASVAAKKTADDIAAVVAAKEKL